MAAGVAAEPERTAEAAHAAGRLRVTLVVATVPGLGLGLVVEQELALEPVEPADVRRQAVRRRSEQDLVGESVPVPASELALEPGLGQMWRTMELLVCRRIQVDRVALAHGLAVVAVACTTAVAQLVCTPMVRKIRM